MMRRPLTTLMLVSLCGSLALLTAWAVAAGVSPSAGARLSPAALAAASRTWQVTLSPTPDDLSLAEIGFHGSGRQRISARSLQVAASAPFGDDYLAVAVPQLGKPGGAQALVLLVNRPSPLADPVSVRLRLTAPRSLGVAVVRKLDDVFRRHAGGRIPALCNLPLHGSALSASEVRPLHSRGQALAGFDAASAVAQAYDVACGLPYASSFGRAVEQPSPAPSSPVPPESPSPAPPAPSPAPPGGKLPGEGCIPAPGYACPVVVRGASPAAAGDGARRARAGAH